MKNIQNIQNRFIRCREGSGQSQKVPQKVVPRQIIVFQYNYNYTGAVFPIVNTMYAVGTLSRALFDFNLTILGV